MPQNCTYYFVINAIFACLSTGQSDIDSIIAMPVLTLFCHSKQGTVYIEIIPTLATMSFNEWGGGLLEF